MVEKEKPNSWWGNSCLAGHLLSCGVSGLNGRFGEGDLDRGQVRWQRVGDALHDVAHFGAAGHRYSDVLGHLMWHFGHLLQHHWGRARRVGPPPLSWLLILIRTADTC